jgi:hypothetical protein
VQHACRMPGAERMAMPYDCPLDHIFEPGRWVNQQLDFRPGSFLHDRCAKGLHQDRKGAADILRGGTFRECENKSFSKAKWNNFPF